MQKAEVEKLIAQQEQLELYLEEKQDLLYVGLDTPRPVRSACSELGLNDVAKEQTEDFLGDFPSKTASTQELGDSGHFRKISGENAGKKRLDVDGGLQMWMKKDEQYMSEDGDDDEDEAEEDDDDDDDDSDSDEYGEDEEERNSVTSDSEYEDNDKNRYKNKIMDDLDSENIINGDNKDQEVLVAELDKEHSLTKDNLSNVTALEFDEDENTLDDVADEECFQSSDEFPHKHPNLSSTNVIRSSGSGRPSRGRTRIQRMRPAPLSQVDSIYDSNSLEKNLTDTAAAVTARLYQPRPPREDLRGNYLKGSRELISSPLSSPVLQRKEFNRESPLRNLSSSSERDQESPPKHSFLRKGSKKQRTLPVHLPLSPAGRHRDKDVKNVATFDFLRKGSRKDYVAEVTKDVSNMPQDELETHGYLKRKDATKVQGISKKKVTQQDDVEKHPYLRRKDKIFVGQSHKRLKRQSGIPSHDRSHSSPTTKSDHSLLKSGQEPQVSKKGKSSLQNTLSRSKGNIEEEISTFEKDQGGHKRRYHSEPPGACNKSSEQHISSQEATNYHTSDDSKCRNAKQLSVKRQREDRHKSQDPSGSSENIPKRKFLKKGSGKQPCFGPMPNFSYPKGLSDESSTKSFSKPLSEKKGNRSKENERTIHRSKSYPGTESFPNTSPSRSRTRLVSSTTSLASVPELSSEEEKQELQQRPQRIGFDTSSNAQDHGVQAPRRKRKSKEKQLEDMEWRRHSHPEGDQLADALAQYTEQMESGLGRDRLSYSDSISDMACSDGELMSPVLCQPESREKNKLKSGPIAVPKIVVSSYDSKSSSTRSSQEKQRNGTDVKVRLPLKPKATNVKRRNQGTYDTSKVQSQECRDEVRDNITSDILENITKTIIDQAKRDNGKDNEISGKKFKQCQEDISISGASSVADSDVDFSEDSLDGVETGFKSCEPDVIADHINTSALPATDGTTDGLTLLPGDNAAMNIERLREDLNLTNTDLQFESKLDEMQNTEVVTFSTNREIMVKCQVPEDDVDLHAVCARPDLKNNIQDGSNFSISESTESEEHSKNLSNKNHQNHESTDAGKGSVTPLNYPASSKKSRNRMKERTPIERVVRLDNASLKQQKSRQAEKIENSETKAAPPRQSSKKRRPKSDSGCFSTSMNRERRYPSNAGPDGGLKPLHHEHGTSSSLVFHRAHSAPSRVESTYQADYVDHTHAATSPEAYTIKKRVRDLFAPSEDLLSTHPEPLSCSGNNKNLNDSSIPLDEQERQGNQALSERTKTLYRSSGSIPAYDRVPEFVNLDRSLLTDASVARKSAMNQHGLQQTSQALNSAQSVFIDSSLNISTDVYESEAKESSQNEEPLQQTTFANIDIFPLQRQNSTENAKARQRRQEQISRPGKLIQIGPNTYKLVSQDSDTDGSLERILTLDPGSSSTGPGTVRGAEDPEDETRWQSQLSEDDPVSCAQQQIQALQEVLQQLSPR